MIRPPIFVTARGALLVFPSLSDAEASLDPLMVQQGTFTAAYDREGRLLRVRTRTHQFRRFGLFLRTELRTELVETEHIATHDEELRAILIHFLRPDMPPGPLGTPDPLEGLIRVGKPAERRSVARER